MDSFFDRLEQKFGNRSIRRLTSVMIGLIVAGYVLQMVSPGISRYMALDIAQVLKGQVWRIITWLLIPPAELDFFTIIMLFFYWSIGTQLERAWGDFRYNLYIFGGILITIIAAFISYFVFGALTGNYAQTGSAVGTFFQTYYICMSILLAFAATFPDSTVLLMFVIPLKMKYLGIIYGIYMIYDALQYIRLAVSGGVILYLLPVAAMAASLINFLVFFFSMRNRVHLSREQKRRQKEFRKAVDNARMGGGNAYSAGYYREGRGGSREKVVSIRPYRHRCEVCGRTEISNPELEFRYCSKCEGAHEFCEEHLHAHIHAGEEGIVDVPDNNE